MLTSNLFVQDVRISSLSASMRFIITKLESIKLKSSYFIHMFIYMPIYHYINQINVSFTKSFIIGNVDRNETQ